MEKTKKKLNLNYIKILLCAFIGILAGIICGLKVNMLKVNALDHGWAQAFDTDNNNMVDQTTNEFFNTNGYFKMYNRKEIFYVGGTSSRAILKVNSNDNTIRSIDSFNISLCYYFSSGSYTYRIDNVDYYSNSNSTYIMNYDENTNTINCTSYNWNITVARGDYITYYYGQWHYDAGTTHYTYENNVWVTTTFTGSISNFYGNNVFVDKYNNEAYILNGSTCYYISDTYVTSTYNINEDGNTYGYTSAKSNILDLYVPSYNTYIQWYISGNRFQFYWDGNNKKFHKVDTIESYDTSVMTPMLYTNAGYYIICDTYENAPTQYYYFNNIMLRYYSSFGGGGYTEEDIEEAYQEGYEAGQQSPQDYQDGYQAGITQGENNVTSSPNDYGLYTEQQYINNSNYSDFIEQQIDSVWVNQPVLNNGYYNTNWVKINNSNLVINEGTIQLDTLYTNNNNITGIRIYFKTYLTNDLPLSFNNIVDPSNYQYTSVYLKCYIETPTSTMNDNMANTCQTTPGISNETNYLELEYSYLVNNINYFEALANTGDVYYSYYSYLKYNCLEISNISTSSNSLNYLNGTLNTINYDISAVNLNSYNMGYDKGYQYGQKANNRAEFNRGYNKGYDDAEQLYADTSGNGNTLVGLAGTILFSPVQMMKNIFNFEILGVNLAGFILSIITLIVVAWLIKRLI